MESRSAWAVVSEVDSDEDGGLVRLTGDKDQISKCAISSAFPQLQTIYAG